MRPSSELSADKGPSIHDWAPLTVCVPTESRDLPAEVQQRGTVLLLHGISGSPDEMLPLARSLTPRGYRCIVPLLAGHCESLKSLSRVQLSVWQQQVAALLTSIGPQPQGQQVVVIGLSFGSLLGLWLAKTYPALISHLVLLSPPLKLRSAAMEALHGVLRTLPDWSLSRLGTRAKSRRPVDYLAYPHNAHPRHSVGAAERALRLRDSLLKAPPKWSKPLLLAMDPDDHLVDAIWASSWLQRQFPQAQLYEFRGGQHELPLGHQSAQLCAVVGDYLATSAAK